MEVHPLLFTWITTPGWHPTPNTRLPVYGYLIRHPAGPILVDTGVGTGNAFIDEQYRPEHRSLAAALRSFDVEIADVRAVVNTHLHFDHCGQNGLFPGVPIYAQAAEIEAARGPRYTVTEWFEFDGGHYLPVDGEVEVFPGVRLIPAGSHTPGHQAVAVNRTHGLVLIAGQAAETRSDFDSSEECGPLRSLGAVRIYLSHEAPL